MPNKRNRGPLDPNARNPGETASFGQFPWGNCRPRTHLSALKARVKVRELAATFKPAVVYGDVLRIVVLRDGDIVVFHAPHGAIPVETPRTI